MEKELQRIGWTRTIETLLILNVYIRIFDKMQENKDSTRKMKLGKVIDAAL
jgi:hypothetical protein